MVFKYKNNDNFWDIESLDNLFTVAFYYPKGNYMILSYLDDDQIIDENDKEQIDALVKKRNKNFDGIVYLENLGRIGNAYSSPKVPGFQTFLERVGFAKNGFTKDGSANEQVLNGSAEHRDIYKSTGQLEVPSIYYPVKDTDPEFDPEIHGYFFGYNSTQYDLTIMAAFVSNIGYILDEPEDPYRMLKTKDEDPINGEIMSAGQLRAYNNELFEDEYRSNMPRRLAISNVQNRFGGYEDYKSDAWLARKAWQFTNRFIDVAKLNESMYRVGLKRLLGMLGHQILEYEGLADGEAVTGKKDVYELLAYNISDVINLRWLFEHPFYQNNFNLRQSLLTEYPQTIYNGKDNTAEQVAFGAKPASGPDINYQNVNYYRLMVDSTSAQFVEKIISPYKKMTDRKTVSFMYPSEKVAKELSKERGYEIKPTDVLEDTKDWFEENVAKPGTSAHDEFMEVYRFYDKIRGQNYNSSTKYFEDYAVNGALPYPARPNSYNRELMKDFNTNLFYYDDKGQPTSCLANFSVGGIHGAEIHRDLFNKEMEEYEKENKRLQFVMDQFDGDALKAINGDVWIENIDGEEQRVREYIKSGSTRKKAAWRELRKPSIFKKTAGIERVDNKYNYVTVGPSEHGDFTSYYPLLLTRLSVFVDPEQDDVDLYYALFERRYEKKKESNDMTLTQAERDAADLIQDSMKLLLNAATGAADATFENNILMNNSIISMRIIGQLFAWRIGQAQTLAGGKVPSTNTDGLYTMNLDPKVNAQILEDISKDMYVGIEPEPIDRFVTKDSNNRLEIVDGNISSARGGTLKSWSGPEPTSSLAHPSAIDRALAYYLRDHENPANSPFDRELAQESFASIVRELNDEPVQILRHFQWILSSSRGTDRYVFLEEKMTKDRETVVGTQSLQLFNRVFLTKPDKNTYVTPHIATTRKVNVTTAKRRQANGEVVEQHNETAKNMLTEYGYVWGRDNESRDEASKIKVTKMPDDQSVTVYNKSLYELDLHEIQELMRKLDIDAYIDLLENSFNNWSNVA